MKGRDVEDLPNKALPSGRLIRERMAQGVLLLGYPDLRGLNDGAWTSDEARAEHLLPVLEALWDWRDWPAERRQRFANIVVVRTIREILPVALRAVGLKKEARVCEKSKTLGAAASAARIASRAAGAAPRVGLAASRAVDAAAAARAVYDAAPYAAATRAADATAAAASTEPLLVLACRIWTEAALASGEVSA